MGPATGQRQVGEDHWRGKGRPDQGNGSIKRTTPSGQGSLGRGADGVGPGTGFNWPKLVNGWRRRWRLFLKNPPDGRRIGRSKPTRRSRWCRVCVLLGMSPQNYYARRTRRRQRGVEVRLALELVRAERQHQPRLRGRKLYHWIGPELKAAGVKMGRDFKALAKAGFSWWRKGVRRGPEPRSSIRTCRCLAI